MRRLLRSDNHRWAKRIERALGVLLCRWLARIDGARRLLRRLFRRRPPGSAPGFGHAAPARVLITKWGNLGDTVLLSPTLRAIRRTYPRAHLSMLCTAKNAAVARALPQIDQVLEFDPVHTLASPRRAFGLIRRLRRTRYDVGLDFDQWQRLSPALLYLAGIPVRIGFDSAGQRRGELFTATVPYDESGPDAKHEVESFLDLVRVLGIEPRDDDMHVVLARSGDDGAADRILERHGVAADAQVVALYPGGTEKPGVHRRWPVRRFAETADAIAGRYDARIVVIGSPEEHELGLELANAARSPIAVLCGETSLEQLVQVLRRAALLVGNDSGPMHLAAAAGTPCVALFGPTNPAKWRPFGGPHIVVERPLGCRPCFVLGRKIHPCPGEPGECVTSISVAQVLSAVEIQMSRLEMPCPDGVPARPGT